VKVGSNIQGPDQLPCRIDMLAIGADRERTAAQKVFEPVPSAGWGVAADSGGLPGKRCLNLLTICTPTASGTLAIAASPLTMSSTISSAPHRQINRFDFGLSPLLRN
jgi:hypothetical protein